MAKSRGLFAWIMGRKDPPQQRRIRAFYDAAQTVTDNEKHWSYVTNLSAAALNSPSVRTTLRQRARYETANNSYANGIIQTLANDLIGTSPRLQLLAGADESINTVETLFARWMQDRCIPEKLRVMRVSKAVDGESFLLRTTNKQTVDGVTLDVKLVEADQVTTPYLFAPSTSEVDGIKFDEDGNPETYSILKFHPGSLGVSNVFATDSVSAADVIHLFRMDRPGQSRGIPEITPAIPLFAQLRRYTLATISAAETAANVAGTLETDAPADEDGVGTDTFDTFELERNSFLTMPAGWKIRQLQAEQPTTTYESFKNAILAEIGRCLLMPFNVAAANSSGYNYSSGRLDHRIYYKSIEIERAYFTTHVLDRLFRWWLDEASLVEGLLPQEYRTSGVLPQHQWFWDQPASIDPLKEASSFEVLLNNNAMTLAEVCAARGQDWKDTLIQRAREVELIEQLGLPTNQLAQQQEQPPMDVEEEEEVDASARRIRANDHHRQMNFDATVEIQAAEGEQKVPRFEMIAYTGEPLELSWGAPVVVDIAGMKVKGGRKPILLGHDPSRIVGHSEEIVKGDDTLSVKGIVSGSGPDAEQVVASASKGFPWQASIGATPVRTVRLKEGQQANANGRTYHGPAYVVRQSVLKEVSFVPLGADGNTSATVAAKEGSKMGFEAWVEAQGFTLADLSEKQVATLRGAFDAQNATKEPADEKDKNIAASDDVTADDIVVSSRKAMADEFSRVAKINKIAAKHPEIAAKAIGENWSEDKTELEVMRADRPKAPAVHASESPVTHDTIVASILMANRVSKKTLDENYDERTLNAATTRRVRDIYAGGFVALAAEVLAAHGVRMRPMARLDSETFSDLIALEQSARGRAIKAGDAGGLSYISLGTMLGDSANKILLDSFGAIPKASLRFCATTSMRDFKTHNRYRLVDGGRFLKVSAAGELKAGAFSADAYTNVVETYGRVLQLSRQDIINDDLGAFLQIPAMMGRNAVLSHERAVFTTLLANTGSFFSSGNANYASGAGSALGINALSTAVQKFREMKDSAGEPVISNPGVVLVPPALETTANEIFKSQYVVVQPTSAGKRDPIANIFSNMFQPIVSPYLATTHGLTNASDTGWYLLAEPSATGVAVLEVGYLNGQMEPTIQSAPVDMNQLGMAWQGYFDFGVGYRDKVAGVLNVGV